MDGLVSVEHCCEETEVAGTIRLPFHFAHFVIGMIGDKLFKLKSFVDLYSVLWDHVM